MKTIVIRNTDDYKNKITDSILKDSFNVYVRVSTISQIENTSLDAQTDLGVEYAKRHFKDQYKYIVIWREEGKSADDRSEDISELVKRELLNIITQKWPNRIIKNLWVVDLSRFSRNEDTSNLLKGLIYKNGIDLYVLNRKYDFDNKMDKLLFGVLSIVNEYENHQRFEFGLRGKLKILESDQHWGGVVPFGYEKDQKGKLILHKFTSKMAKMMFQQYAKGISIKDIIKKLEEIGALTQRGNNKWTDGSVRKILKNDLYHLGRLKYEVKLLKGKSKEYCRERGQIAERIIHFDPIIDKETFDKVQQKIIKNKRGAKKPTTHNTALLREMLFCGNCGAVYYGKINPKQRINTYRCQTSTKAHRKEGLVCDNNKGVNITLTDDLVWKMVVDTFADSERIKRQFREENIPKELNDPKIIKKKINSIQTKVERRRKNLNEIERRKEQLFEQYVALEINKKQMDRISAISDESANKIKEEIKSFEAEIQILKGGVEWEEWFEDFNIYIEKIKSYTSIEQRRKFIETIVEKIFVSWDGVTNTHNLKIQFKLNIVKDRGKLIENQISEVKKGINTLETNKLDFHKMLFQYKKVLKKNALNNPYSTVTDFAKFRG